MVGADAWRKRPLARFSVRHGATAQDTREPQCTLPRGRLTATVNVDRAGVKDSHALWIERMPIGCVEFSASRLDLYPLALLPRAKRAICCRSADSFSIDESDCGNIGNAFADLAPRNAPCEAVANGLVNLPGPSSAPIIPPTQPSRRTGVRTGNIGSAFAPLGELRYFPSRGASFPTRCSAA